MAEKDVEMKHCSSCGEKIRQGVNFCPECGENNISSDDDEESGPTDTVESGAGIGEGGEKEPADEAAADHRQKPAQDNLPERLNSYEATMVIGGSLAILGTFLDWAQNPLASVAGMSTDWGLITIGLSILVIFVSFRKTTYRNRVLTNAIFGCLIIIVCLIFIDNIQSTEGAYIGGGVILTSIGGIIILLGSIGAD